MRVVFLADYFLLDPTTVVTGSHVQMFNLARAIQSRGIEVHYVCQTKAGPARTESVEGVILHLMPAGQGVLSWTIDLSRYRKRLDDISPDTIYQRGRSYLTLVAARWARRNGKRFVWASNGEDSCDFWKETRKMFRSRRSAVRKLVLLPNMIAQDILIHRGVRRASVVINQTLHQSAQLFANYAKRGVVLPSIFPAPVESGQQPKEKMVLWLANISPAKQPEIFIDLARECLDMPDWRFLLAGGTADATYMGELAARAGDLPNLRFAGRVQFENSAEYFARASLFVNTSRHEADGLPNSFIQAWLHATPVLSLNHDPNGWIGEHDLGCCAHGDNAEFMMSGRALLASADRRQLLGKSAARFAMQTFAGGGVIEAYIHVLAGRDGEQPYLSQSPRTG